MSDRLSSLISSTRGILPARIFYASEIRELEKTLAPVESLIDRAAAALSAEIRKLTPSPCRILGLAGTGNNARDCLQALLRLSIHGYRFGLAVLDESRISNSPEWKQIRSLADFVATADEKCPERIYQYKPAVVLDGMFGIGFRQPLTDEARKILKAASSVDAVRVAIDVPSGVMADTAHVDEGAFKADVTVTFFALKPAHIFYPARQLCGDIRVKQLGFAREIEDFSSNKTYIDFDYAPVLPLSRKADAHKKTAAVMMVAGSERMQGAAVLAGEASFAAGAGYVGWFVQTVQATSLPSLLPEAVLFSRDRVFDLMKNFGSCIVGPGLGRTDETVDFTLKFLEKLNIPAVVDGDALFALAVSGEKLDFKQNAVLTPHTGEARRLLPEFDSLPPTEASRQIAAAYNAVCILKTPVMAVSDGRETVVVRQGSNILATAGTGDLLSGITGALLAQGLSPFNAAVYGAVALSAASHLCEADTAGSPVKSRDLVSYIRMVFRGMCGEPDEG